MLELHPRKLGYIHFRPGFIETLLYMTLQGTGWNPFPSLFLKDFLGCRRYLRSPEGGGWATAWHDIRQTKIERATSILVRKQDSGLLPIAWRSCTAETDNFPQEAKLQTYRRFFYPSVIIWNNTEAKQM